jgi:arylformamidase
VRLDSYPPQEPLSALGAAYQDRVLAAGAGIDGAEFAYGADPYQSLALFRPAAPSGDVLVFFHGGGWTSGYKEWMAFMAPALLAHGITFVSAGYRLAPTHLFPAGLDDAADAVGWVARHIAGHGGSPERIFVGGHSAGGHYAALLAATSAWRRARGLAPGVVRGCLPVSGVYRFGEGSGLTIRPRFLGPVADATIDAGASPLLALEADLTAPWLLAHGSRDFPHLIAQARQMAEALAAAGIPVDVEVLEGCDHFEASAACGDPAGSWVPRVAQWLRQVRD